MMRIECPWCGGRDETEFHYGGEAHIARPEDPDALSDEAWADYLFMRANPEGRPCRALDARPGLPAVVQPAPPYGEP